MSVAKLIQNIDVATADSVVDGITAKDRTRLLQACDDLRVAYEDPMAAMFRMMFAVSVLQNFSATMNAHGATVLSTSVSGFKDSCWDEDYRCRS
jgi:hypothetical protein